MLAGGKVVLYNRNQPRRRTMLQTILKSLLAILLGLCASSALAQMPNPYGAPISLENAKKAAAAGEAEARKNNWKMAFAVTDISGDLVYLEKMEIGRASCRERV